MRSHNFFDCFNDEIGDAMTVIRACFIVLFGGVLVLAAIMSIPVFF